MKKILMLIVTMATLLLMVTGCKGEPLPEGMDEDALFVAGKDVVLLLVGSEFEAVHEMLREDVRGNISVDQIRATVSSQLDGAGVYKQIEDHMATGQVIDGVLYGVSVLYCEFSEEDVLVRVSFDQDWNLVGFALDQR